MFALKISKRNNKSKLYAFLNFDVLMLHIDAYSSSSLIRFTIRSKRFLVNGISVSEFSSQIRLSTPIIFDSVTESILCVLLLIEKPNSNLQDKYYHFKKP